MTDYQGTILALTVIALVVGHEVWQRWPGPAPSGKIDRYDFVFATGDRDDSIRFGNQDDIILNGAAGDCTVSGPTFSDADHWVEYTDNRYRVYFNGEERFSIDESSPPTITPSNESDTGIGDTVRMVTGGVHCYAGKSIPKDNHWRQR